MVRKNLSISRKRPPREQKSTGKAEKKKLEEMAKPSKRKRP